MVIWIRNDFEQAGIDEEKLRRRAQRALGALGCEEEELSIWLCSDEAIRELHRTYLGADTPTNVMSFAQREGEYADLEPGVLGDVVVSVDTARRDAQEGGLSLDDELSYLLIHGILHLVGYDHEGEQAHRAPEMEAKESELFELVRREA
ncbi:MAG: rRNA maturation RNase YbeY [Deltaproteobacteria bacterium]|nr:rRNA maturation RNase YbeY [Deltaproteobacteria bacterium]